MAEHIEKFNESVGIEHTSLLVKKMTTDRREIPKHSEEEPAQTYLRYMSRKEENLFGDLKEDPRYVAVKERLARL